ncbi:MAG: hypothetical protein M1365_00805 [Actinobacteria bacterium]|nr:hypothetical protein [Actinomycetota bacterium]
MRNFLLGFLVMLLIGVVAFVAYRFGFSSKIQSLTPSTIETTTQTIDDVTKIPSSTTTTTLKTLNDLELIREALFKKNNWKDSDGIIVNVSTNNGLYASGTATSQGGGGYFFAAKTNGIWEIVADGNGVILCSALSKYPDYPKTLIPECWDESSQKNITR